MTSEDHLPIVSFNSAHSYTRIYAAHRRAEKAASTQKTCRARALDKPVSKHVIKHYIVYLFGVKSNSSTTYIQGSMVYSETLTGTNGSATCVCCCGSGFSTECASLCQYKTIIHPCYLWHSTRSVVCTPEQCCTAKPLATLGDDPPESGNNLAARARPQGAFSPRPKSLKQSTIVVV